jgi:hypothetical protein
MGTPPPGPRPMRDNEAIETAMRDAIAVLGNDVDPTTPR